MRQNQTFRGLLAAAAIAFLIAEGPAQALPMTPAAPPAKTQPELAPTQVRAGGRGGHGGGMHGRPGGGYHGGYHGGRYYGGAAWVRPYRWAPGGAIAAGAAIGFVTAATAAAWASAPPRPGLCWYYTDASRRAGFWDNCP